MQQIGLVHEENACNRLDSLMRQINPHPRRKCVQPLRQKLALGYAEDQYLKISLKREVDGPAC